MHHTGTMTYQHMHQTEGTGTDVALNDHASELALRILQSGTVGPWRIRDRDLLGPRNLVTYDVVPEGITMADAVEGSNAHRQITTAVADLTEAAEEEWFEELAPTPEAQAGAADTCGTWHLIGVPIPFESYEQARRYRDSRQPTADPIIFPRVYNWTNTVAG
jgi:hypothetical protein